MLRPLNNMVVVRRVEADEVTAGGLVIPPAAREKTSRGAVVASATFEVSAGDHVCFPKYAGHDIRVDGEDLLVMRLDDLLCVVDVLPEVAC